MLYDPIKLKTALLILLAITCGGEVVVAQSGKRGIAGGPFETANALNAEWMYRWSNELPADVSTFHGEYVPMIWSANTSNANSKIDVILSYANDLGVDYVLGFNEPERVNQANMSVAQAIDVWDIMTDRFEGTGIKLVSPAGSGGEGEAWLADFMGIVDSRNADANPNNDLRVDEIAFHWYGNVNPANPVQSANNFLAAVDRHWNTYGLPVWITEFAGLDFGDDDVTSPDLIAANAAFLDVVVPQLESRSYVNRYAWWQYGQSDNGEQDDTRLIEQSSGIWTPTVIGDQYIPSFASGEVFDLAGADLGHYNIYLRGGTARNTGASLELGVGSIYAFEGESTLAGTSDWGADGGSLVVAAGATLVKSGSNRVRLSGLSFSNEGALVVEGGTLKIEASSVAGGGGLTLQPGAKLELGNASDRLGVTLGQAIELNGGTIESNPIVDGLHRITSTATLNAQTRFAGGGSLIVTGVLSGPGGLTKEGSGLLSLNAVNSYSGDTTIKQGRVRLGSTGSIASSPVIHIESQGILDVSLKAGSYLIADQTVELDGVIQGDVEVGPSAVLVPTHETNLLTGDLQLTSGVVRVGGAGFNRSLSAGPIITAGLVLNFDAANDAAGDSVWTDSSSGQELAFAATATPTVVSDASFPGITAAYSIPGSGAASGLNGFFELAGPRSKQDATFEVVFHLSDTTAMGEQVLFEAGGAGRGLSLLLTGGNLSFNVNGDDNTFTVAANGLTPGWHQAVGVIDVASGSGNDAISLFIDSVPTDSAAGLVIGDWSGGNLSGIGDAGDSLGAGGSPVPYHDQIAAVRYYQNVALDAAGIEQNYQTLVDSGVQLPTTFHLSGDFEVGASGVLEMDLSDEGAADKVEVGQALSLTGGVMHLSYVGTAGLAAGDRFDLFDFGAANGAFDSILLPSLETGLMWDIGDLLVEGTIAVTLAGDYNGDGMVDLADYSVWRDALGQVEIAGTGADGDGSGLVDAGDYTTWKSNFGRIVSSAVASQAYHVPEPSGGWLAITGLLTLAITVYASHRRSSPQSYRGE